MLVSLLLPIILATVALFFASFVSWMVLPWHRKDWVKLEKEDEFMNAVRNLDIPVGSYMIPGVNNPEEMKSEEFQNKQKEGPCGILTVFRGVNMGQNLGLTIVYFLVVSFCLGYLATIGCARGDDFMKVFRFVSTAGLMTFLAAIVQHSIWFKNRIVGHVLESILYALIVGLIFAALWPGEAVS